MTTEPGPADRTAAEPPPGWRGPADAGLLLDNLEERLGAFRLLRAEGADVDAVLQELGATGQVDRDIVLELSSTRALGRPDRFWEAHALAMRSVEVLDRNATRGVRISVMGPLDPVASFAVQLVVRWVTTNHQRNVLAAMGRLYASREATCAAGDPHRRVLQQARMAVDRVEPRLRRDPVGVPAFLLGGAFVSSVLSFLRTTVAGATEARWLIAALVALTAVLFLGMAWAFLRGAAVARRRIVLTTERPLQALWETVGRCGTPPRDQSRQLLVVGLVATVLAWVAVPLGVVAFLALT